MKLSQMHSSSSHRCIIYGGPKSGKSLLAGKLAEHYKIIWVDMENGFEVLFQLPAGWQENIEVIRLPDTRSYPIAIETCLKMVKGPVNICHAHGKDKCMICKREDAPTTPIDLNSLGPDTVVVFDSLTQLSNSAIANITKDKPDDYKLEFDDWGNLGKLLDIFLSHIQQSTYHCIVISHEVESETEGKKKRLVPVGGTRNFSRNVAKYFDHVVYMEVKNRKHTAISSTTAVNNILTGSRTNVEIADVTELEELSLLPIFKPELFPDSGQPASKPTGGAADTSSALARLKAKT